MESTAVELAAVIQLDGRLLFPSMKSFLTDRRGYLRNMTCEYHLS